MKIIEIRNTNVGEVAYILDEAAGRVIKVLVDDYTGYSENTEAEPERPRRTVRRAPKFQKVPGKELTVEDIPDFDLPPVQKEVETEKKPFVAPDKRRNSIIPPHLKGIFLPADTPGAAVEKRVV